MIDLFPFGGLPVAVLGLGAEGLASARSLALSGAEVLAWDEDEARRGAAEAAGVEVRDLRSIDWREPVSLVVEHDLDHRPGGAGFIVAAARRSGCEVISDAELLARAQRDASYLGVVSRSRAPLVLDAIDHVVNVTGGEAEAGGDPARPILELAPLELGGIYALDMPPGRTAITVSITFDCALVLDLGEGAWPPFDSLATASTAARRVLHRQSAPKSAIFNMDDEQVRAIARETPREGGPVVLPISARQAVAGGVYCADGTLFDARDGTSTPILPLPDASDPLLAAAAYAAGVSMGVKEHAAMASVRSFFDT